MEITASLGIAVGCHPYYPQNISTGDTGAGSGDYFEPCWPMPILPGWEISTTNAPLTLQGELDGATLSIHVGKSGPNAKLEVLANGVTVDIFDMPKKLWEDNGDYWYGEDMLTCVLPEGTSDAEIWVCDEDAHMDTVIVEGSGARTVVVFSSDEEGDTIPLPIIINGETVVLKELYPKIAGVLIVAEGANSISVFSRIQQAAVSLLDININQIEILTMR